MDRRIKRTKINSYEEFKAAGIKADLDTSCFEAFQMDARQFWEFAAKNGGVELVEDNLGLVGLDIHKDVLKALDFLPSNPNLC